MLSRGSSDRDPGHSFTLEYDLLNGMDTLIHTSYGECSDTSKYTINGYFSKSLVIAV